MEEQGRPNLSLGEPPVGLRKKNGQSKWWFIGLILLQAAILIVVLPWGGGPDLSGTSRDGIGYAPELKETAMRLEDRGLKAGAARAWERFVDHSPASAERNKLLYRAGKLYFESGEYERAADAFVRAEVAGGDDPELEKLIAPKMVECLRRLGLYGEVGRELSRRVEVGGEETGRGRVLATFAGETFTEADLDRLIEQRVDRLLAMRGGSGQARARMLAERRTPDRKKALFQEILQTQLFTRRARELALDREEDFIEAREFLEESLLAERFLKEALQKIQPTEIDLKAFHGAYPDRYVDEESGKSLDFETARERVFEDYIRTKQREIMEKLAGDLMARYEVKILALPGEHQDADSDTPSEPAGMEKDGAKTDHAASPKDDPEKNPPENDTPDEKTGKESCS